MGVLSIHQLTCSWLKTKMNLPEARTSHRDHPTSSLGNASPAKADGFHLPEEELSITGIHK